MSKPHFARFPFLYPLEDKNILIIGGGMVAERKIKSLLQFNPQITIISPQVTENLDLLNDSKKVKWICELFRPEHINTDFHYIFTATNCAKVNNSATKRANELHIPINIADNPNACDFHMPAIILDNNTGAMISISSNGESPTMTKKIKQRIQKWINNGGLDNL